MYNVNHIALVFEEVNDKDKDKEIQLRNSLKFFKKIKAFVLSAEFHLHSPKNISKNPYSGEHHKKIFNITILTQQLYTGIYYQNCFTNLTLSNE